MCSTASLCSYRGRIDDQYRTGIAGGPTQHERRGDWRSSPAKPVEVGTTPVDGCVIAPPAADAGDKPVTYADHIAPILRQHCQRCHQPNTAAPFALLTYEQAKARARTVAEVVNDGRMPPWFAVPREGDLIRHQTLSAAERETVTRWVATGLTRGDDSRLPKPPDAKPAKWLIGEPDLVLSSAGFELPKEGDMPYKYVVFAHFFAEDTWVQGVQILPDVPRAVHHANLAYFKLGESFKESNFVTGVVPGASNDGGRRRCLPHSEREHSAVNPLRARPERRNGEAARRPEARPARSISVCGTCCLWMRVTRIPPVRGPSGEGRARFRPTRSASDYSRICTFAARRCRSPPHARQRLERLLTIPNYNFEWQIPYRWEPGKKVLPKERDWSAWPFTIPVQPVQPRSDQDGERRLGVPGR